MKKKIIIALFILMVIGTSTFSVYATCFSTETSLLNYLSTSTTICQNWSLRGQGTYTDREIGSSHLENFMFCTQNGNKAKTQITFGFGHGANCYCETYVYNTSGVLAANAHKSGSNLQTSAIASVNVSSINVKSVLHIGNVPQVCEDGEHSFLLFK